MTSILFVCTGNICRSPLAEAILRHRLEGRPDLAGIRIDSAGLVADHLGEPADRRMRQTARQRRVTIDHRSRRVTTDDLDEFDLIVAMDDGHLRSLSRMRGERRVQIRKMLEFDPANADGARAPDVPDPWYGGMDGFEEVYEMVDRAMDGLVREIERSNRGARE